MPAPTRLLRSAAAVALATSATGLAYAGSAAPARAAGYNGYCTSNSGVTVVVDFRSLGGGIAVRCSPVGSGANGIQALQAAGIPVEGTHAYGLATPCRIYGKPSASTTLPGGYHEQCGQMPPESAYWSYWHAPNGGPWTYSSEGPLNRTVIPGGFEGWAFSTGTKAAPGVAPRRSTPPPPPKPAPSHTTTAPPVRHTTTAPRRDGSTSGSHSSSATHSRSASHTPSRTSTKSPSTSSSAPAAGSSSATTAVAAGGAHLANSDHLINQSDKSSGVNATTVVGGIVLAVLVIGGGAVAIMRRRGLG